MWSTLVGVFLFIPRGSFLALLPFFPLLATVSFQGMNLPQKKAVFFAIVGVLVGLSVLWWLRDFFFAKRFVFHSFLSLVLFFSAWMPAEVPSSRKCSCRRPSTQAGLLIPPGRPAISVHYDLTMKVFLPGYESHFPAEKNLTFDGKVPLPNMC